MSRALLDDHLLRDLLTDDVAPALGAVLADAEPATTNLYYLRLCRSVTAARGGSLTGSWSVERRRDLGRVLARLPDRIAVVPLRQLAVDVAVLATDHRLSTLGAEAVAAAQALDAPLYVWDGDDGPGIRAAAAALGLDYRPLGR